MACQSYGLFKAVRLYYSLHSVLILISALGFLRDLSLLYPIQLSTIDPENTASSPCFIAFLPPMRQITEGRSAADSSPKDSASQYQLAQAYELGSPSLKTSMTHSIVFTIRGKRQYVDGQFRLVELYLAERKVEPDK
ncbi:hypothetical protein OK016_01445 [Vibrio chagasii]|nr:hypothetical protein [Vibrio chagasii]